MSINGYFAWFAEFNHKPNAPVLSEFNRLANLRGWHSGSKRFRSEMEKCLKNEADVNWESSDKLAALQDLCEELGVRKIPDSKTQCRKALSRVHVNIIDLIDARRTGSDIPRFANRAALRQYTDENKKFFPRKWAKKDGALSALLIQMA